MQNVLDQIEEVVPALQGWCTVEKAHWLARWIHQHDCLSVVEIGVFGGRSIIPMALAMKTFPGRGASWPGKVIGVDSYSNRDSAEGGPTLADKEWWAKVDLSEVRKGAEAAIKRLALQEVCQIWIMTGEQAVTRFDDSTLDMVHVDGSHGEADSVRDVKSWWPKLRTGGVMVMDDVNLASVGAAQKLAASLGKLVHHADSWEAYQKAPPSLNFPPG